MKKKTKEIVLNQILEKKPKQATRAFEVFIHNFHSVNDALEMICKYYELCDGDDEKYIEYLDSIIYDDDTAMNEIQLNIIEDRGYGEDRFIRNFNSVKKQLYEELSYKNPLDVLDTDSILENSIFVFVQSLAERLIANGCKKEALKLSKYLLNEYEIYFENDPFMEQYFHNMYCMCIAANHLKEEIEIELEKARQLQKTDTNNSWPYVYELTLLQYLRNTKMYKSAIQRAESNIASFKRDEGMVSLLPPLSRYYYKMKDYDMANEYQDMLIEIAEDLRFRNEFGYDRSAFEDIAFHGDVDTQYPAFYSDEEIEMIQHISDAYRTKTINELNDDEIELIEDAVHEIEGDFAWKEMPGYEKRIVEKEKLGYTKEQIETMMMIYFVLHTFRQLQNPSYTEGEIVAEMLNIYNQFFKLSIDELELLFDLAEKFNHFENKQFS